MAERSQEVILREGRVVLRSSRQGGQWSPVALTGGPAALAGPPRPSDGPPGWYDEVLAEGGYLVDFDRRRLLAFSWDDALMEEIWPQIKAAWPGWSVEAAPEGTADFARYLAAVGLPVPG